MGLLQTFGYGSSSLRLQKATAILQSLTAAALQLDLLDKSRDSVSRLAVIKQLVAKEQRPLENLLIKPMLHQYQAQISLIKMICNKLWKTRADTGTVPPLFRLRRRALQ